MAYYSIVIPNIIRYYYFMNGGPISVGTQGHVPTAITLLRLELN
jgi:hypothetical protein